MTLIKVKDRSEQDVWINAEKVVWVIKGNKVQGASVIQFDSALFVSSSEEPQEIVKKVNEILTSKKSCGCA